MVYRRFYFACCAALTLCFASCTDNSPLPGQVTTPVQDQIISETSQLKTRLLGIAETGTTGSGLAGLRDALKATNQESMLSDLEKLESAKSPDEAKRIAKSMADKLK